MTDRDPSRPAIPAEMTSESWAQSDHVRPLSAPPTRWTALLHGISNDVQAGGTAGCVTLRHALKGAPRQETGIEKTANPLGERVPARLPERIADNKTTAKPIVSIN
jgi:hypothetical protein